MSSEINEDDKMFKTPKRGILRKSSNSIDVDRRRSFRFDEMNIIATYHPADKDYGHMKIDESPTPYNRENSPKRDSCSSDSSAVDATQLANRLTTTAKINIDNAEPIFDRERSESVTSEQSDDDEARRRIFIEKRRQHYDEYRRAKEMLQNITPIEEDASDLGEQ